jgi:hypothetical protein
MGIVLSWLIICRAVDIYLNHWMLVRGQGETTLNPPRQKRRFKAGSQQAVKDSKPGTSAVIGPEDIFEMDYA